MVERKGRGTAASRDEHRSPLQMGLISEGEGVKGDPETQAINCSSLLLAMFEHCKKGNLRLSQKELFTMRPTPVFSEAVVITAK